LPDDYFYDLGAGTALGKRCGKVREGLHARRGIARNAFESIFP
jgi:hypothetical protein